MDVTKEVVEHYDPLEDGFGFTIRWKARGEHWIDFEVFEVTGLEGENGPRLYDKKDWQASGDEALSIDDSETYADGYIKWDGCSEIDLGQHHFCGPREFKKHIALVKWLYTRAYEVLGTEPDQPWED